MRTVFKVTAVWDPEIKRWNSQSNVDGLFIETDTLDEFEEVLFDVVGSLVMSNHRTKEDLATRSPEELVPTIVWMRPDREMAA